ncbi:MAG TPA: hypothetical protein PLT87_04830 [Spirochaetales bacterium]|nr:hypothetical protein [Spirochaetales bacterium]
MDVDVRAADASRQCAASTPVSGVAQVSHVSHVSHVSRASRAAWNFAQMDEVWRQFRPQTPYGKDFAAEKCVYACAEDLASAYEDVRVYGEFATHCLLDRPQSATMDKIQWHLGRIPRLPPIGAFKRVDDAAQFQKSAQLRESAQSKESNDASVDIFLYKKFLSNYAALCGLLDSTTRAHFGLQFESDELLQLLLQGGSDPETFFVSEKYDSRLTTIRQAIADLGDQILRERTKLVQAVKKEFGIDLEDRDFVTIPHEQGLVLLAQSDLAARWRLVVEANDEYSFIVRLLPNPAVVTLQGKRETLYETERSIESEVVLRLSQRVNAEAEQMSRYCDALRRLDVAKARYELKKKYSLVFPVFSNGDKDDDASQVRVKIRQGRFLPLCTECEKMGTQYTPLELELEKNALVLFGSNMGGKTVVLKTVLFLQLMAQTGLGVPADKYETSVFDSIDYVGERPDTVAKGLSSFGFEVQTLSELVEKQRSQRCLVAFDEFAQTTSSEDAEALLSAVVHYFSRPAKPSLALFATHFHGLVLDEKAHYCRMAGLDKEAADRIFSESAHKESAHKENADKGAGTGEGLAARIRTINRLMRYEVIPLAREDLRLAQSSDALLVASLLGLDSEILAMAERYRAEASAALKAIGVRRYL